MQMKFHSGFVIYKNGKGPTYVTPHSGPALETTTSRDDNSETVASLCWMKTGGTLIVSNISRKRMMGIDFNRGIPPMKKAIAYYDKFERDEKPELLFEYRNKYAWVAKDEEDYNNRLKIYNGFWDEVRKGDFIVLVHRAISRLKAVPSAMDLTTFDSIGVDKIFLQKVVRDINSKYSDFFKQNDFEYKNIVYMEQKRIIANTLRIYGDVEMKKLESDFKTNMKKDMQAIRKYAGKKFNSRLKNDFSPQNFLLATRSALEHIDHPRITVEHVFSGKLAMGTKNQLFPSDKKRIVIQFEPTTFLNSWYPEAAANMIIEIINRVAERNIIK